MVTITVMTIEWVIMEELMMAAAIAVTTFGARPAAWPGPPQAGARPRGRGAGRSVLVVPGRFGLSGSPELAGRASSGSTASTPFAHGDESLHLLGVCDGLQVKLAAQGDEDLPR